MSFGTQKPPPLERLLAAMLSYGTWLASAVIAAGLLLAGFHTSTPLVTLGIALFILLPVLRVALMLIVFTLNRDYSTGAAAALVLAIILLGFAVGAVVEG